MTKLLSLLKCIIFLLNFLFYFFIWGWCFISVGDITADVLFKILRFDEYITSKIRGYISPLFTRPKHRIELEGASILESTYKISYEIREFDKEIDLTFRVYYNLYEDRVDFLIRNSIDDEIYTGSLTYNDLLQMKWFDNKQLNSSLDAYIKSVANKFILKVTTAERKAREVVHRVKNKLRELFKEKIGIENIEISYIIIDTESYNFYKDDWYLTIKCNTLIDLPSLKIFITLYYDRKHDKLEISELSITSAFHKKDMVENLMLQLVLSEYIKDLFS